MEKSNEPQQSPGHHDIFEDPSITRALKEDPLFKFLSKWWRQCLAVGVVAFIGWYAKMRFDEAAMGRLAEGRTHLISVQEAYDGVLEAANKKSDSVNGETGNAEPHNSAEQSSTDNLQAALARLAETQNLLADSTQPYSHISELYRSLELRFDPGKVSGNEPGLEIWQDIPPTNKGQRLIAELEALALARIALDKSEARESAEKTLRALVDHSEFAHTAAAIALARALTADNRSANDELQGLIKKLKERKPEQAELIDNELQGLLG